MSVAKLWRNAWNGMCALRSDHPAAHDAIRVVGSLPPVVLEFVRIRRYRLEFARGGFRVPSPGHERASLRGPRKPLSLEPRRRYGSQEMPRTHPTIGPLRASTTALFRHAGAQRVALI